MEEWTFTEEMHKNKKGEEYMVYYAAPKPYKYGFIAALTKESRQLQYDRIKQAEREREEEK